MRGRFIVATAALAVAGGVDAVKPGSPAPDYAIRLFDHSLVRPADLAGKVVVINRWATWCGPCRSEMPAIDAYYRRHRDEGLRVFAVTTEGSLPQYRLKPLAAALSFPLAASIRGGYDELGAVPTTYVIDRRGTVRYAKSGALDEQRLDAVLAPLLAEPAP